MAFTKKEKNFILKNYKDLSVSKIAEILNCSEKQISDFLLNQNLKAPTGIKEKISKVKDQIFGNFEHKSVLNVFLENKFFWISIFILVFLLHSRSFGSLLLSDEQTMYSDFAAGKINWSFLIYGSSSNHYWSYLIFGYAPWANRLITLLLHLINLILFYTIFRNFISEKILKIAVLLLSVHSLLVEPIVWIAANPYVYHGLIYLLIMYSSLLYERTKKIHYLIPYYLLIINFTLSGGHTNYAPLFAVIFNLFILKRGWKKEIIISAWLFLLIPIYPILNRATVESRIASLTTGPYLEKYAQTLPFTVAKTLEITFFPLNLALFHEETLTPVYYAYARLLTLFFIGLMFYLLFKKEKIYFGLAGIACAFCIYIFSPVQISWFVAERYMYFSVFIACLFLALLFNYLNQKVANLGNILIIGYFFLFLFVSYFRYDSWVSLSKLWESNVKISPDSYRVRNNLAESYSKEGEFSKAQEQYLQAIRINPNFFEAYFNLANSYLMQSKLPEAEEYLLKTLSLNPAVLEAYVRLAIIKGNEKNFSLAYSYLEQARELDPNSDLLNKVFDEIKKYEAQQKN